MQEAVSSYFSPTFEILFQYRGFSLPEMFEPFLILFFASAASSQYCFAPKEPNLTCTKVFNQTRCICMSHTIVDGFKWTIDAVDINLTSDNRAGKLSRDTGVVRWLDPMTSYFVGQPVSSIGCSVSNGGRNSNCLPCGEKSPRFVRFMAGLRFFCR